MPANGFQEGFPGDWSKSDQPVVPHIFLLTILDSGYQDK